MTVTPFELFHVSEADVRDAGEPFSAIHAGWYLVSPGSVDRGLGMLYATAAQREPLLKAGARGPFETEADAATQRDLLLSIDSGGATDN